MEKEFLSELYQDIINLGGLNNVINEALKSVGSKLQADANIGLYYSRIEHNRAE